MGLFAFLQLKRQQGDGRRVPRERRKQAQLKGCNDVTAFDPKH